MLASGDHRGLSNGISEKSTAEADDGVTSMVE